MILLSGATGSLGAPLLSRLRTPTVALLRGADHKNRAAALARRVDAPVTGLEGDVVLDRWGLGEDDLQHLRGAVDVVVHLAAETRWSAPWERLERVNVLGTSNAIAVARSLDARLIHVSSLFVGYDLGQVVDERPVPEAPHLTNYERSKCRAETLVLGARRAGLDATIVRMGAVVGDFRSGSLAASSARVRTPLLRLLRGSTWPAIPVHPHARVDIVPRDLAVDRLAEIALGRGAQPEITHVSLGFAAPTVGTLMTEISGILRRRGDRSYRTVAAPPRLLKQASLMADRLGSTQRSMAVIGLRYLASETLFATTYGVGTQLTVPDLVRCIGLPSMADTIGSPVPPYYDGWPRIS